MREATASPSAGVKGSEDRSSPCCCAHAALGKGSAPCASRPCCEVHPPGPGRAIPRPPRMGRASRARFRLVDVAGNGPDSQELLPSLRVRESWQEEVREARRGAAVLGAILTAGGKLAGSPSPHPIAASPLLLLTRILQLQTPVLSWDLWQRVVESLLTRPEPSSLLPPVSISTSAREGQTCHAVRRAGPLTASDTLPSLPGMGCSAAWGCAALVLVHTAPACAHVVGALALWSKPTLLGMRIPWGGRAGLGLLRPLRGPMLGLGAARAVLPLAAPSLWRSLRYWRRIVPIFSRFSTFLRPNALAPSLPTRSVSSFPLTCIAVSSSPCFALLFGSKLFSPALPRALSASHLPVRFPGPDIPCAASSALLPVSFPRPPPLRLCYFRRISWAPPRPPCTSLPSPLARLC